MAALSEKPSMPTTELGARMIDAYGAFYGNDDVTLPLMDLREIPNLYNAYTSHAQNAKDYIASDAGFKEVSKREKQFPMPTAVTSRLILRTISAGHP